MDKKSILKQGWDFAYNVEGWYPPLKDALRDVDDAEAEWHAPGQVSNSIRELVNHLFYYKRRFLFRLEGKVWPYKITTNDETFLPGEHTLNLSWKGLLNELAEVHRQIQEYFVKMADRELDQLLLDKPVDEQILTLLMHDAYHTGQIVFIRKLYGSWGG